MAHLYDWSGSDQFAADILAQTLKSFALFGIQPPVKILDLACGSGHLACKLAEKAFNVIGIDLSSGMLDLAKQSSKANYSPPEWRLGDMRHFTLQEPVEAILCHYDSLNHLCEPADFIKALQAIKQALKVDGYFFFDLNCLSVYQEGWQGEDCHEGPNYRLISQSTFNEETGLATANFTAQEYDDNGSLNQKQELLQVRYHNEDWVKVQLEAQGFQHISCEPFLRTLDKPDGLKTYWTCQSVR